MSAYFESLQRGAHARPLPSTPIVARAPVVSAPAVAAPVMRRPAARYETLRERLLVAANGHPLRAIVFAGCSGGEGTSAIVRDFGEHLATSGLRVLIVDLQEGHVATTGAVNLTQLVARDWPAPAATFGRGQLTVVASQGVTRDKEQFYRSPELAAWMIGQRARYDYLLFAAPPIASFADGTLLGRLCDGVVLVIEAQETRRAALVGAREQLESHSVRVIGAVLNRERDDIPERVRPYFPAA